MKEGIPPVGSNTPTIRFSASHPVWRKTKRSCMVITSPSILVISLTLTTFRLPSRSRLICTTIWIADATCSRIARSGRSNPAISTSVSSRESASRGELA